MKQFPGCVADIASHLPERVVDNAWFAERFPEWRTEQTEKRTGVLRRHLAAEGETAYDLSVAAVKKLLARHPGLLEKVDAIIYCTQTPDYVMPSNAFLLQKDLGIRQDCLAFDYNLACSGFVYGLLMASGFIKTGMAKNILLVTADTYSRYLANEDRATRMLFGDGAAAAWIAAEAPEGVTPLISGFTDFICASDGAGWDKFIVRAGAQRQPSAEQPGVDDKIVMNGMQVVNFVNHKVIHQVVAMMEKHGLATPDVGQFFLHQASGLAVEAIAKRVKAAPGQVHANLAEVGNTVSSSLPILIEDYFARNALAAGSPLLICGFGVGYSWGTVLAER